MKKPVHIALDFDKTLAYHESKWGISKVGDPIMPMVEKVKEWISKGYGVTIFTVRMSAEGETLVKQIKMIDDFLVSVGLPILPKTAMKQRHFSHFVDDRAYHVKPNSGIISDNIDI